jgi:methionyl-tRNA formyltransferase
MTALRVVFMGTPDFAVPALEALIDAGHDMVGVYTQPPRPAGRGRGPRPSPVQKLAECRGIPVRAPTSLKSETEQKAFAALRPDIAVVAAYGLILTDPVLAVPRLGCITIPASVLPRWRGAAPIQRAIMAGDETTGITIMGLVSALDAGPILRQRAIPIGDDDAGTLHDRLSKLGAEMIPGAVTELAEGRLEAVPQPVPGVTYAAKLTSADERLDWSRPAIELGRRIRALSPAPGAYFMVADERWKALAAEAAPDGAGAPPGTVLDHDLTIACGTGILRPTRIRRPGRKTMATSAALRGAPVAPGTRLD